MDVPPPAVDPEILTRNLAALQAVAPDLAEMLSARPRTSSTTPPP